MLKTRIAQAALVCGIAAVTTQAAIGATATANIAVSATVLNACIVIATPLLFGNYDPTAAGDAASTALVTVTCTPGVAYTVGLNQGMNGSSVTARQLKRGSNTDVLNYGLYRDASHSQNWGATPNSDTNGATAGIAPAIYTVYGLIPSGQQVPSGAYSDTVQVSVNY